MYDTNSIPSYNAFVYWFLAEKNHKWTAILKCDNTVCKTFEEAELKETDLYYSDFQNFKLRPEYIVGYPVQIYENRSDNISTYEKLLMGTLLIRARREVFDSMNRSAIDIFDADDQLRRFNKLDSWLTSTDFFSAPASTVYHQSYEGGLLVHSLNVYNAAVDLSHVSKFATVPIDSYTLVALAHDWCKIGLYEPYQKNVKNETTGQWEKQTSFKYNQTGVPLGHGVSSMFLVSKFVRLSADEALAIRWHMGAWRVVESEMNELQLANEKCPLVHMIQFADQLSIVQY